MFHPRSIAVGILALCAGAQLGCLPPLRSHTPTPIPALEIAQAQPASPCTAILLPGTWDRPADFVRHGFAAAVAQSQTPLNLVAVDTHMGYYRKQTVVERLRQDFVAPLRAKQQRVWLVGASLGSVGSLLYSAHHRDEIEGIVLFAPFLGDPELLEEIRRAGGPKQWPTPPTLGPKDWQRRVWSFLRDWHQAGQKGPKIYLAYGESDDFAPGNVLMSELLPAEQVYHRPGGHDWKTWRALWQEMLDDRLFDSCR